MKAKIAILSIAIVLLLSQLQSITSYIIGSVNITVVWRCGDGVCQKGEDCRSCPADCGSCPVLPTAYGINEIMFEFNLTDKSFENLHILLKKFIKEAFITARSLNCSLIELKPKGILYSCISIKSDLKNEYISKGFIYFKVDREWIDENRIDESSISLYRVTEGIEKLPTEKIAKDDSFLYFRSNITSLSIFIIAGQAKKEFRCQACPEPEEWSKCINGIQSRNFWICSALTGFECIKIKENRACFESLPKLPLKVWIFFTILITAMLIINFILSYFVNLYSTLLMVVSSIVLYLTSNFHLIFVFYIPMLVFFGIIFYEKRKKSRIQKLKNAIKRILAR